MRKPDMPVREVVCSETGKPMPKIPMWMADINVKFVSDEARQKHSGPPGILDVEQERRGMGGSDLDEIVVNTFLPGDEEDPDFDDLNEEGGDDVE